MPREPRRRIAEGVNRDRYSLTTVVKVSSRKHALTREEAFPADTPLEAIQHCSPFVAVA
jgi:hypothetical protein